VLPSLLRGIVEYSPFIGDESKEGRIEPAELGPAEGGTFYPLHIPCRILYTASEGENRANRAHCIQKE
jgi:hypothetical protein